MNSVFESKDYKHFLNGALKSPQYGRGARTKLAQFLNVQSSYISLVLAGSLDFAPEHAIKLAQFFNLNEEELDFLLLLIQRDRAGEQQLKLHIQRKIDSVLQQRSEIKNQIKETDHAEIPTDELRKYYSKWYHTAIHMYLRTVQTIELENIAKKLKLNTKDVKESIDLLVGIGFIKLEKGKVIHLNRRFHAATDELSMRLNHHNWRHTAIQIYDQKSNDDLFYTSVMSIDASTFIKMKKMILDNIKSMEPAINDAKDQDVFTLNIDLYKIS